jgi:hypothetical protein
MIVFHNPGLIPLEAIRLMGASVKTEGSFGRFGTGLKYAVATIMRGGGSIRIWRGAEELRFESREASLKDKTFEEVVLVNPAAEETSDTFTSLGFTTELGKDWEPWMVLRELACNARDEGGDFFRTEQPMPPCFSAKDGETVIAVDWDLLEAELDDNEHCVFAPAAEALTQLHGVRVLPGPSKFLYHRGVRVWKLPKESIFTYDIVGHLDLTEDRTVKYSFIAVSTVRNMFLRVSTEAEAELVTAVVTAKKGTWEAGFDWKGEEWATIEPGPLWLETVAAIRNNHSYSVSDSAKNVLLKHQAFRRVERGTWIDSEGANERLSDAAEIIEELGFDLEKVDVFITDELPGNALSATNKGSVFLTQTLLEARVVVIVREIVRRLLELRSEGDHDKLLDAAVGLFFELAVNTRTRLKRELDLFTEEAKSGSVADMLLIVMDMRGEEYPARPSELVEEEVQY